MLHLPARTLSPSLALIAILALAASAAEAKPRGGGPAPAPVLELAEAERLALANHPMIRGALAAAARDREMPAVEGSLADPTLELEFMGQPATTPSVGRAMSRDYTLRQMRMHPAKRRAMRDAASAMADATGEGVAEARLAVLREVRGAYTMLGMAREEAGLVRGLAGLLRALRDAAQAKFAAGTAGQSELLRIDVELSRAENGLVEARRNEEAARAMLAAAAGLTGETRVEVRLPAAPKPVVSTADQILALAARRDPALARAGGMARAAEARLRLARAARRPDAMLGLTYRDSREEMTRDSWSLMAGLNLPIYRRRLDAAERAGRADVAASREMGAAREVDLAGAIGSELATFRGKATLFERARSTLLPKAERAYEAALTEYRNSQADLERVIMAAMTVFDLRMERLSALAAAHVSRAELERLAGGEVE